MRTQIENYRKCSLKKYSPVDGFSEAFATQSPELNKFRQRLTKGSFVRPQGKSAGDGRRPRLGCVGLSFQVGQ